MKKNKFFSILLVISMIVSIFAGTISAEAAEFGDYSYEVNADGTTCTILYSADYKTKFSGDLTIPSELDGYKVTAIHLGAFSNCDNLQNVTIPGSIESIGYFTFAECDNLQSITLLEGVKAIEAEALRYSSLKSISIPASVTTLSSGSFYACKSLTSINVDAANMNYVTQDGVLYNKDKTTLICYPDAHPGKVFDIPAGVTTISGAFEFNSILTNITIPDSVTTIDGAFYDCSALTGVIIPSGVTSIGNQTFYSCEALTYVMIPCSVTSIGYGAFEDCTALTSVTIPSNVTSIEGNVFSGCSGLTNVYFDGLVNTFSSNAFYGLSPAPTYYCPTENKDKFTSIIMTAIDTKTVTVNSSIVNGSILPSTLSGMPGETISFKITPNAGYILKPGSLKYSDGSADTIISGGSITMPNNPIIISAVFEDSTPLVVSSVMPIDTGISSGGNIVITFSEAINTTGTVSLDGGSTSLNGGSWSADKITYTIPYSSLSYSTAYTVAISAFKDAAGNAMTADSTHSFTTMAAPHTMMLDTSGILGGAANWVYYGKYSGSPVMWRVLESNNDYDSTTGGTQSSLFLLSEYILDSSNIMFDNDGSPNAGQTYPKEWQHSDAQTWCTSFASTTNFSAAELAAVAETNKSDSAVGEFGTSNLINDKVFFLSAEEVQSSAYGFTDNTKMIAKIGSSTGSADEWRLRSSHATYPNAAGIVAPSGGVAYDVVSNSYAARPAFNLNLSSVLFSSASAGGKSSGTVGAAALNLVSSTTPTDWKLTLADSSRSFAVTDATAQTVAQGATASISYTGATVGTNEYVSAMIVDDSNNILYYGRIKAATAAGDAGATADITIPAGLAAGNYTLKLFSEQYNGDKKTDYASEFSNVALTVNAAPYSGGSSGSGSGGSSGGTISVTTNDSRTTATQTITATTGANGVATASVTNTQISDMIAAAGKKAADTNAKTAVNISVNTARGATGVSVTIPQAAASSLTNRASAVTISSSVATVTLDSTALAEIGRQTTGDVTITATSANSDRLSDEQKSAIGSRPVYDLKITSGSTTVSGFGGGTATVSVPYTPAAGEDTSKIVVYYVSGSGALIMVPNCVYNKDTGAVTFTTTHFSTYAVAYNDIRFADVSGSSWYADSVSFLASRKIINGTGDGKFSPEANITRAEFVTILAKLSGDDLSGYTSSSFSDVATTNWYFAAVQWAYKNGIAAGSDGKFDPVANITREQMAVMLYHYAEYAGTVSNVEGMSVREFSDYTSISNWAQASIQWAMNNSIISGNTDGSFTPAANATRAQASKINVLLMQGMIRGQTAGNL